MTRIERLLLWLIASLHPRRDREWLLGDLEEDYRAHRRTAGHGAAAAWLAVECARTVRNRLALARQAGKGTNMRSGLGQDLRFALRMMRRNASFTLICACTIALGVGANTAIFSIVRGVLLTPLPYPHAQELVRVFEESMPRTPEFPVSPGTFADYRDGGRAFASLAAYIRQDLQLGGDQPEALRGMRVTSGFFALLGYAPVLGREFTREDERPGREQVVILSHALWVRRFASDPSIVGRTVALSGRDFVVVGVLPAGVQHVGGSYRSYPHGDNVDVWWPETVPAVPARADRLFHYLNVIGRLKTGVTVEQAQQDVRAFSAALASRYPDTNARWSSHTRPLNADIIGTAERPLIALFAAACAVLLIACLNVAGLLVGRAIGRTREVGVRTALGASRRRVARQLAVESVALGLLGAAVGIPLAYGAVDILVALAPADLPRVQMIAVDRVVLAFGLIATLFTSFLFGLAPAFQLARSDAASALAGGRGAPGGAQQRTRRLLVVAQIAVAFTLVVIGGLLLRSFATLLRIDHGFQPDHVLTARIALPPARYAGSPAAPGGPPAPVVAFYGRLLEEVRQLPGVRSAGMTSDLPWSGYNENLGFAIVGRRSEQGAEPGARYHFITPGTVAAVGTTLIAGRDLRVSDDSRAPRVALINETTARLYWRSPEEAIGARLNVFEGAPTTIVGVIGDVRDQPWAERAASSIYFPIAQRLFAQDLYLLVRADGEPQSLATPLARLVHDIDPELPLAAVRPLTAAAGAALAGRRFTLALVGGFAVTALFLAVVGVYGVLAQAVGQRGREFGIRLALGARPAQIRRQVLGSAAALAAAGLAIGLAFALPAARFVGTLLYHTRPSDPATLLGVAAVLVVATLAASWVPARRATRVDPAAALRRE